MKENSTGRAEEPPTDVPPELLERMAKVTTEEAWGVLDGHDYKLQFEGDWTNLQPERILVGRAVTCRFVPARPDVDEAPQATGPSFACVVETLKPGDVLVVEASGQIAGGSAIGYELASIVEQRTGGTGLVVDGGIRDLQRLSGLPISVFCRGAHPASTTGVSLVAVNGPVRIGHATVLPGDVVLGTPTGVIFVPPSLAEEVVDKSEQTRLRDYFGKMRIGEGVYTPGEIDRGWSDEMTADYEQWRTSVQSDDIDP